MSKYIITLLLSFQIILIKSSAQEVIPSLEFAAINYENQNYRIALKEYLRLFYFDRKDTYSGLAAKIASCFSHIGDSDNAIKYYRLSISKSMEYSREKENTFYSLIQELIINKRYKIALAELFQCPQEILTSNSERYHYYLGMTYLFDQQVLESIGQFKKLSYSDSINPANYDSTMKKIEKTINRKQRRAKFWSCLLPGLGQTINGDARDGLNSFAINGSLVIIFIQVAKSLSFADASLTVVPWFFRFYTGGIRNAGLASKAFQAKKLKEHSAILIQLLAEAKSK